MLSFQQFGQKIRKFCLDTGAPHFRHTNLVLFLCNGPQISQRFHAVSGSLTCTGYCWCQFTKCWPPVDGGLHGGRQHRVACYRPCCFGHREIFHLICKHESSCTDRCIWKPLEIVAGSGVFENSAVMNDKHWYKFLTQIDHKLCSGNSARLQLKGKYWRERFLVLGKQLPNVFELSYAGRLCFSSSMFWLICQTNALGTTWTYQNVLAKWSLTCFLMEHFKCNLPAPGNPPPPDFIYTKLMQILRVLLKKTHQKLSYWKAQVQTIICRMLASRLKFICHIRAK